MVTINGKTFCEVPPMCGNCPFLIVGGNDTMGWCALFEKKKSKYANLPRRCTSLFERAFQLGGELVIVAKD